MFTSVRVVKQTTACPATKRLVRSGKITVNQLSTQGAGGGKQYPTILVSGEGLLEGAPIDVDDFFLGRTEEADPGNKREKTLRRLIAVELGNVPDAKGLFSRLVLRAKGERRQLAVAYVRCAERAFCKGKKRKAAKYYFAAGQQLSKIANPSEAAKCYCKAGRLYYLLGEDEDAFRKTIEKECGITASFRNYEAWEESLDRKRRSANRGGNYYRSAGNAYGLAAIKPEEPGQDNRDLWCRAGESFFGAAESLEKGGHSCGKRESLNLCWRFKPGESADDAYDEMSNILHTPYHYRLLTDELQQRIDLYNQARGCFLRAGNMERKSIIENRLQALRGQIEIIRITELS